MLELVSSLEGARAVDLNRHINSERRGLGCEELRHRGGLRGFRSPGVVGRSGRMHQETRRLHARGHAGELMRHPLKARERMAERRALCGIPHGRIERSLRHANRERADAGAEQIERAHRHAEALIQVAHDVVTGDEDAVEPKRSDGMVGDERRGLTRQSGTFTRHREARDAACSGTAGSASKHRVDVGFRGVGYEHLLTTQSKAVAVGLRAQCQ